VRQHGGHDQQQAPAQRQPRFPLGAGQQTKMANVQETLGQDVLCETPQELDRVERHGLVRLVGGVVSLV
jgi:hypothetical protein